MLHRVLRKAAHLRYQRAFPFTPACNRHRVIFIHVPKAAGTSVRVALGEPETGRRHLPWWVYKEANPRKFRAYFKFAFVRDPLDRVLSGYNYLRAGGNGVEDRAIAEFLEPYDTFESFVEACLVKGSMIHHPVFRPQSWFLSDWRGNLQVDFLGRFESLDQDFASVASRLGLLGPLPVTNRSAKVGAASAREVSPHVRQLVARVYAEDYRLFGYEPEGLI